MYHQSILISFFLFFLSSFHTHTHTCVIAVSRSHRLSTSGKGENFHLNHSVGWKALHEKLSCQCRRNVAAAVVPERQRSEKP